jgi:hypothetical protein
MKLNTETATGHCLELAFWLFFAFLGLLLPCSNANSFCGPGPHLLKSKPLQIYAVEGQQTVVKVKELQAIAISSVRWWAKPTKAQSIFEYSTTMQDNDTQVTLIMSKELDRVRIRYQIQYTSSSGSEKKFKSSTATLNLADASNVVQVNKSYVTANSKGPVDTYFTILCFDVKYGTSTVKDVQIYRKKNTEFCRVPVSNSLYSYDSEDSCVRLGPLGDSHTDDYCALVEDCFTRVNNFSFQFRLPEASPTTPGLPTAADVVETSLTPGR